MKKQCIYEMKIDAGFKRLIPPLSAKELEQLEQIFFVTDAVSQFVFGTIRFWMAITVMKYAHDDKYHL